MGYESAAAREVFHQTICMAPIRKNIYKLLFLNGLTIIHLPIRMGAPTSQSVCQLIYKGLRFHSFMSEFERPAYPNHEAITPSDTSLEKSALRPQGNPEQSPIPPHGQGHDPDTILMKLQQREERRNVRPIQLYKMPYQLELERGLLKQLLSDTLFSDQSFQTDDLREEIREKARADLTPQERESLEIEETIFDLKHTRGISRRINHIMDLNDPNLPYKLEQHDPEFMNPIIEGWKKRPARLKKAEERIECLRRRRGKDQPPRE